MTTTASTTPNGIPTADLLPLLQALAGQRINLDGHTITVSAPGDTLPPLPTAARPPAHYPSAGFQRLSGLLIRLYASLEECEWILDELSQLDSEVWAEVEHYPLWAEAMWVEDGVPGMAWSIASLIAFIEASVPLEHRLPLRYSRKASYQTSGA